MKNLYPHNKQQFNPEIQAPERPGLFRTKAAKTVALGLGSAFTSLLLVASQAAEPSFFFSTGAPDGLMATATRPGPASGANQETESGDDFILSNQTLINSATITGLLPAGVNLSDVSQVRVEIYRVFPKDSDPNRTPHVPTRVNSPADVEFVDRDSTAGDLTFTVTQLAASFTAANSVDTGIHPSPNQTTHGEGPKTGKEVKLDVTFTTPFNLAGRSLLSRPAGFTQGSQPALFMAVCSQANRRARNAVPSRHHRPAGVDQECGPGSRLAPGRHGHCRGRAANI